METLQMNRARDLTATEVRVLGLVKTFEKAVDNHRLTVSLHAPKAAADLIAELEVKHKLFRILKVDFDQASGEFLFTWTVTEYEKYLAFVLSQTGMQLFTDGSIKTHDNLIIPNTYLNGR
jgi:hypothetical protein